MGDLQKNRLQMMGGNESLSEKQKVYINFCAYDELLTLPSVGELTADRIWDLRKRGDITPDILATVPHIRMHQIHEYIDYTPMCDFNFSEEEDLDDLDDFDDKCSIRSQDQNTVVEQKHKLLPPNVFDHSHIVPPPASVASSHTNMYGGPMVTNTPVSNGTKVKSEKTFLSGVPKSYPNKPQFSMSSDNQPLKKLTFSPGITSTVARNKKRKVATAFSQPGPQFSSQKPAIHIPVFTGQGQNYPGTVSTVAHTTPVQPSWSTHVPISTTQNALGQAPGTPFVFNTPVTNAPNLHSQLTNVTQVPTATAKIAPQANMLKSLKFDGSEKGDDWVSFLGKFEMYAEMAGLSEEEKRAHLCWTVTGVAARFCLGRVRRNKNITFSELVKCMEKRFNLKKLTETVRIQFQSARQSPGEDLDDWAERLLSLADKAFPDLPEDYVTSEVITKLCQGCSDKHAGSVASSFRPKSVDEALERIKWQQYNDKAVFGTGVRTRDTRENYDNADNCDGETQTVNSVKTEGRDPIVKCVEKISDSVDKNLKSFQSHIGQVQDTMKQNIKAVQEEMKDMERRWRKEIASVQNSMSKMMTAPKTGNDAKKPDSTGKLKRDMSKYECYNCHELGHIAKDCGKPKRVRFNIPKDEPVKDLNGTGSV